jgi:hypothetical protein
MIGRSSSAGRLKALQQIKLAFALPGNVFDGKVLRDVADQFPGFQDVDNRPPLCNAGRADFASRAHQPIEAVIPALGI